MNRATRRLVCGLACITAPLSLANPIVDLVWSSDGRFAHESQVASGKFAEICGTLAQGASVLWKFESSGPTDFNIHYHVGKEVVYPVKRSRVAAAEGVLAVSVPQDYCWMWTNKGAESVRVKIELSR